MNDREYIFVTDIANPFYFTSSILGKVNDLHYFPL